MTVKTSTELNSEKDSCSGVPVLRTYNGYDFDDFETKVPINFNENLEKDDTIWTRYIGSEYVSLIFSRSLIFSSHERN
jgi:hypothetical protein